MPKKQDFGPVFFMPSEQSHVLQKQPAFSSVIVGICKSPVTLIADFPSVTIMEPRMFENITAAPADPILGLADLFVPMNVPAKLTSGLVSIKMRGQNPGTDQCEKG